MTMDEEDLTVQNLYRCNKVQQKRIKDLEDSLSKYGGHRNNCAYIVAYSDCDCGFIKALKG